MFGASPGGGKARSVAGRQPDPQRRRGGNPV
jgi:hypothetical protein